MRTAIDGSSKVCDRVTVLNQASADGNMISIFAFNPIGYPLGTRLINEERNEPDKHINSIKAKKASV